MSSTAQYFAPLVASTGNAVKLAMQRLWLTGQVLPAGARLTVQHVFRSEEDKSLEVIYAFPLPRDAALRRFRITGDGFEAHSELHETEAAVKAYEQGIAQGSLSALARQYGDGLVNLTVGNLRPKEIVTVYLEILAGVELRDDGFRFRFPFTLAPAYHPRAKAALVAPGEGEMELPASEFGDVMLPRFCKDASALHQVGFELSVISQLELEELGSPSHGVRVKQDGVRRNITLGQEKDVPDRDLVLDARFKEIAPQILAGLVQDGRNFFAAIVPSSSFGAMSDTPRRVVILLDRSGSMAGAPLTQAIRSIEACLGALSEQDLFGLVAFDDKVETFQSKLLSGSGENRYKAHEFLQQVSARGGTELAQGILEAVKLLDCSGGDVLILTDGQVAGTEKILADARSTNTRLHCLGIGSASQDRFLSLLARETGGVSRFVTPRERVDLCAVDLFASIGRPIVSGLKVLGNVQPEPPTVVFSGAPVLLFGEGEATSGIELTWDCGRLSLPITFSEGEIGETVRLLQGSRLITDWESRYPSVEALAPLEKRKQSRIAVRLRELSETYELASREMSLVAVVKRAGDRPSELPDTRVVPVGMAQDVSFGAYFASPVFSPMPDAMPLTSMFASMYASMPPSASVEPPKPSKSVARFMNRSRQREEVEHETSEDLLIELASRVESDGGMRGKNAESRAAATVVALFAFLSQGHTSSSGAFRSHVARLVSFLRSLTELPENRQKLVDATLELARKGQAPAGDWLALAGKSGDRWEEIEEGIGLAL